MKLLDVLQGCIYRLDDGPADKTHTERTLYNLLAQKHTGTDYFSDIGLGDDLKKQPLAAVAFTLDHNKGTAKIANIEKLFELATLYQTGDGVTRKNSNSKKYGFCLAVIYAHAAHIKDEPLRVRALAKLFVLYCPQSAHRDAEVHKWLLDHQKKGSYNESQYQPPKSFGAGVRKKFNEAKQHAKHFKDQICATVSHATSDAHENPHAREQRLAAEAVTKFLAAFKEQESKEEKVTLSAKQKQEQFFLQRIADARDFKLPGLKALLILMLDIQNTPKLNTEFKAVRTERTTNKGAEANTTTWQRMVNALKDKVLAKLLKQYANNANAMPQTEYVEYYKLLNASTSRPGFVNNLFARSELPQARQLRDQFNIQLAAGAAQVWADRTRVP